MSGQTSCPRLTLRLAGRRFNPLHRAGDGQWVGGPTDRLAGVLKSAILASDLLGVTAGLLYVGATQVTIALQYCDCGFKAEETISQFWTITIVQGATNWLSYGAIGFGAIGVATSALTLGHRGLPQMWRWISWSAAGLLILSIALHEVSDTPAGDLVAAVA